MPPTPSDVPVGRAIGLEGKGPSLDQALETLLVDLGPQIQRGASYEASIPATSDLILQPTGLEELDVLLGGGFPSGRLSEICGPAPHTRPQPKRGATEGLSAGRTSLALELVAETLSRGKLAAWVDLADAFDPPSALAALRSRGRSETDLDRLLWVRARDEREALRCCERVMRTEGFELVIFDLFLPMSVTRPASRARPQRCIQDVTWLRLARLAAGTRTALVALSQHPVTGSRAELILEMQAIGARFVGPPTLLESIGAKAVLRRHRGQAHRVGSSTPLYRSALGQVSPTGHAESSVDEESDQSTEPPPAAFAPSSRPASRRRVGRAARRRR